jgi:hypothetical protein
MAVKKTTEDIVDSLESNAKEVTIVLESEGKEKLVFVQKPLTFFGKIELFSVLGKATEKIIDDGGSIVDLIGDIGSDSAFSSQNQDAEVFVKAISRVIQYVPETLGELYCVILNIPRNKREEIRERLESDLDDDQGFGILETFVDQNWEVMKNFFKGRILPLAQKVGEKSQTSEPLKP